jgi:hypothetical protein
MPKVMATLLASAIVMVLVMVMMVRELVLVVTLLPNQPQRQMVFSHLFPLRPPMPSPPPSGREKKLVM